MFSYERHGCMVFFRLRVRLRKFRAFNALLSFMRQTSEVSHNIYTQLPSFNAERIVVEGKKQVVGPVVFYRLRAKAYLGSMIERIKRAVISSQELIFQLILHGLVFSFYAYDGDDPQVESYQVIFFLNYTLATAVISYGLLPQFFYRKKYLHFLAYALFVVAGVIAVEELILEKIYFPRSRGKSFPGVFYSLWEVLPVMAILAGAKFAWDALYKQREVDQLRVTIQESELQFLKSQINPHFLFNNLNNLYSYAIANSPKTPTIILELSSVLRYMLYECREKFVPLSKEIEQLENFTRLSELQIEERGVINFTAQDIASSYLIAPLILIVFIENAFKHSQAGQSENIMIDVQVRLSGEGQLHFVCKNNFQTTNHLDQLSHGIGLENVKKRLALLYPGAHQLDIRQTDTEYEVRLSMQLSEAYRP